MVIISYAVAAISSFFALAIIVLDVTARHLSVSAMPSRRSHSAPGNNLRIYTGKTCNLFSGTFSIFLYPVFFRFRFAWRSRYVNYTSILA
jgi:hypothetical protein